MEHLSSASGVRMLGRMVRHGNGGFSSAGVQDFDEIVEDSEPERASRMAAPPYRKSAIAVHETPHPASEIIVITDDEKSFKNPKQLQNSVIEISDDSLQPNISSIPAATSPTGRGLQSALGPLSAGHPADEGMARGNTPERFASPDTDVESSPLKVVDLSRFAFSGHSAGSVSSASSRAGSILGRGTPVLSRAPTTSRQSSISTASNSGRGYCRGRPRAQTSSVPFPFNEEQLKNLRICIICHTEWTTRKSSKAKQTHITSCAKENLWSSDVVFKKIQVELDDIAQLELADDPDTKKKGKGKAAGQGGGGSLFAHVVNAAEPKKRTKKAVDEVITIKSIVDTRALILEKANAVLGQPFDVEPNPANVATISTIAEATSSRDARLYQPDIAAAFANDIDDVPLTQSILASKFSAAATVPLYSNPASYADDMPPPTQGFAPSRLGSRVAKTAMTASSVYTGDLAVGFERAPSPAWSAREHTVTSSASPTPPLSDHVPLPAMANFVSSSTKPKRKRRNSLVLSLNPGSASSSVRSLSRSPRGRKRKSLVASPSSKQQMTEKEDSELGLPEDDAMDWEDEEWGREADLIWDGADGEGDANLDMDEITRGLASTSLATSTTTKAKAKTVRKKRGPAAVLDDADDLDTVGDLYKTFKDMILADRDLHLRILRYEPIKFEDLEVMAAERGVKVRGLKTHLRHFLDEQCIQSYTAETTTNRQRRRR